jgi:hypothetical protein
MDEEHQGLLSHKVKGARGTLNPCAFLAIFVRHCYYSAYGVEIFSNFEIRALRVVGRLYWFASENWGVFEVSLRD